MEMGAPGRGGKQSQRGWARAAAEAFGCQAKESGFYPEIYREHWGVLKGEVVNTHSRRARVKKIKSNPAVVSMRSKLNSQSQPVEIKFVQLFQKIVQC